MFFYNSDFPRPIAEPPADPSRNWSAGRNNGLSSASPSLSPVSIRLTRKIENPAVRFCASRPIEGPRVSKLPAFSTFYAAFEPSEAMAGRDFSPFVSSSRLGLVFLTNASLLYAVHYRLVKANIRPSPSTRNRVRQRHFPFLFSARSSLHR